MLLLLFRLTHCLKNSIYYLVIVKCLLKFLFSFFLLHFFNLTGEIRINDLMLLMLLYSHWTSVSTNLFTWLSHIRISCTYMHLMPQFLFFLKLCIWIFLLEYGWLKSRWIWMGWGLCVKWEAEAYWFITHFLYSDVL